ncbi:Peptide methionine sulfoxide reductase [Borrelia coriaceae ATCC 43381]|uniref:Peptide methionine sulfoxide reductase n=1 Tax=Borrelia coriaceae ATCC 43381 TaxID=1408429 RepID=W5SV09_9SPIR|nr:Peptide methionine sulfoxide reductase [Borrelia coriaceae ATCC 43381]
MRIFKFERDARDFLLSLTGQCCFSNPWEDEQGIYEFKAGFSNFRYPMLVNIPMPGCMSISIAIVDNLSRRMEFSDPFDALTLGIARHMLAQILSYEKNIKINFGIFATPLFKLINRYMFPIYKSEYHNEVFNEYLKNGYLISPIFDVPSLVPLKFSKGDVDNFLKVSLKLQDKFGS